MAETEPNLHNFDGMKLVNMLSRLEEIFDSLQPLCQQVTPDGFFYFKEGTKLSVEFDEVVEGIVLEGDTESTAHCDGIVATSVKVWLPDNDNPIKDHFDARSTFEFSGPAEDGSIITVHAYPTQIRSMDVIYPESFEQTQEPQEEDVLARINMARELFNYLYSISAQSDGEAYLLPDDKVFKLTFIEPIELEIVRGDDDYSTEVVSEMLANDVNFTPSARDHTIYLHYDRDGGHTSGQTEIDNLASFVITQA
jgi:hypothetical protein